jgi:octaprenyl-diphosphate synthase
MTGAMTRPGASDLATLQEIQAPVRQRLEQVPEEMRRIVVSDLPMIEAASTHLMQMRGKMFRPTLSLLSSAAAGTPEPQAVTVSAIVELLHLATLVHDDSVDHSTLRRGLPTINALFSHQVSVIMGDYLYSRALVELVGLRDIDLMEVVAHMTNQLTIGEMRQLAAVETLGLSEEAYYDLIAAKTASLLGAACETGALCGAREHRATLSRYGNRLGMAFQIVDDVIDYTEDSSVTGKPSGNDLREHKVTLPLIAALPSMSAAERRRVETLFSTPEPDDAMVADVTATVIERGGITHARECGERFAAEAEEVLGALPESPVRQSLSDAIGYVTERRR